MQDEIDEGEVASKEVVDEDLDCLGMREVFEKCRRGLLLGPE